MNTERDLDECTAQALDALLTLATAATRQGRPELALCANAAIDELLAFLLLPAAGTDSFPATDESRHAHHQA